MPKDAFEAPRRRDIGNRALREGNYERPLPRRKHQRQRKSLSVAVCPYCGSKRTKRSKAKFRDGTLHVRLDCAACSRFVKWGE